MNAQFRSKLHRRDARYANNGRSDLDVALDICRLLNGPGLPASPAAALAGGGARGEGGGVIENDKSRPVKPWINTADVPLWSRVRIHAALSMIYCNIICLNKALHRSCHC